MLARDGARDDFGSAKPSVSARRDFGRGRGDAIGLRPDLTARFFIVEIPRRANRVKHSARRIAKQRPAGRSRKATILQ